MNKAAPLKINALSDLKQVKREIEAQAKAQAEQAAAQAVKQRQAVADKDLFIKAAGAVQPLPDKRQAVLKKEKPKPQPAPKQVETPKVLGEALSDEFDVSSLLPTDPQPSYTRPGIGPDVTRKLRQGHWKTQAEIDLHGLRIEAARDALGAFLREAKKHGLRCVRVVHGKGLSSPGQTPVLKSKVQSWLVQKQEVMAFVQAPAAQGGAGALVVLLQP